MSAFLLLPGCISLFLVLQGRIRTAFLSVYLPALLFLPEGYGLRLPHLPPTSAAEFALIPIGIAAFVQFVRRGSFLPMDILVVLYFGSITITNLLKEPILNNAIFWSSDALITMVLSYVAGRQLIEPELRIATVRRIVVLILLLGPLGLFEWRFGQNLYGIVGNKILGIASVPTWVQMRAGHGRMGGAFTDTEIAGIVFGITFAFNAWLVYMNKVPGRINLGRSLAKLEKFHIPGLLLLLYLFLTQSRGPEGALIAALLILQVPRFKNARWASIVVGVLLVLAFVGAATYYHHYTNISDTSQITEQQGSALYRRQMNEIYSPIAQQGGWLGWGLMGVPKVAGIVSIDNEFLRVWLVQGRLGLILLILITAETVRTLVVRSWRFQALEDRAFTFSMLAAMAVLWLTLSTVYMGEQLPQFAFLLIGWSQSILEGSSSPLTGTNAAERPRFLFRRVLQ